MYCTHCFSNLFKDDPRVQQIRTKSHDTAWFNHILSAFPLEGWVWDKPLYVDFSGGCCATKRRIDLRILIENSDGLFWLCVEIDENQHKSYAAGYEEGRYNDLFVDFSGRYVFLRINPDAFRHQGQRVNPTFEKRAAVVEQTLGDLLREGPQTQDLVEVHHLFYDTRNLH